MQDIYRVLARLMQTDLTVMISGKSGTGKELVARALHDYGKRRNGPFVAVNMAAIPRSWLRASCSGMRRAHSPARASAPRAVSSRPKVARCFSTRLAICRWRRRRGCCACCNRANTPRWAGARRSRPMSGLLPRPIVICASSSIKGLFREDLFFRLNVVPIRLPPLRERSEDIPDLIRHFLAQGGGEGLPPKTIDGDGHGNAQALSLAGQCART